MNFPKSFFLIIDKFSLLLLPIVFIPSGFVNIFLYYFGIHQNDELRRNTSIAIFILIFIVSLLKLIIIIKENNDKKKKIGFVLGLMTFYVGIYISALFRFDDVGILKNLLIWGIYSVPAAIFAMDIALNKREKILFKGFRYCSMILLPAAVIYVFLTLFNINPYTNGVYLGKIDYMSLAYTYMIPMFFMLLCLFIKKDKVTNIDNNSYLKYNLEKYITFSIIILSWILIICSGLRGALVSVAWFFICIFFYMIRKRYDKRLLTKMGILFFSIWIFFTFIFVPTGINNSVNRLKSMITITDNQSGATRADEDIDKASYAWIMSDEEVREVRTFKYLKNRTEVDEAWWNLAERNDKIKNYMERAGGVIPFFNRTMLYDFALYEFSKNPLYGIGAFSYTVKYRTYPHNILLEILCEWGIIIFASYITWILLLLRKLYKSNNDIQRMFLFFVGLIPMLMISGAIYDSHLHMIFIVYASCVGKGLLKE